MDDLKNYYRENLSAKITALEAAGKALEENIPDVYESIQRIAHTLRGSGTTYGFPEIQNS